MPFVELLEIAQSRARNFHKCKTTRPFVELTWIFPIKYKMILIQFQFLFLIVFLHLPLVYSLNWTGFFSLKNMSANGNQRSKNVSVFVFFDISRHKFSPLVKFHDIHQSRRYTSDWVSICFSNVVRLKLRLELLRRCLKGPKLGTDFKRKPADLKKKVDAGWKCWYSSSVVVVVHVVSVLWFLFSKNGEIAKLAICARGRMGLISLPYQLLFLTHGNRYKFVFYFANKLMICLYARELNSLKNIKRSVQKPE